MEGSTALCYQLGLGWMLAALAACSSTGNTDGNPNNAGVVPFGSASTESSGGTAAVTSTNSAATPSATNTNSPPETSEVGATPVGLTPGAGGTSGATQAAATATGGAAGSAMTTTGAAGSATMTGAAGTTTMPPAGAAGTANMPAPPTASNCPPNALFCDDFESDTVGQFPGAPWQNQTGGGATVKVDSVQAFSGTKAVHVNAGPNVAYRRGYFSLIQAQGGGAIFPAASKLMFGRAMMFLDATPNVTSHWTVIQAEGRAADGTHDTFYRYGGQQQNGAGLMASYETNNNVSTDCYTHSAMRMPTQQWTCMEWRYSTTSNEMQLWINGNEVTDLHVTDRPTSNGSGCLGNATNGEWIAPPNFTTLHLGWENYQAATNDRNLWVDDVVVSTERIGCPAR